jgi:hypothetical protein
MRELRSHHSSSVWSLTTRGRIQKFPDWVDNEINNNNNKHSLRSNTRGFVSKTHYSDSQNSDTTAPSGRKLYPLQFSPPRRQVRKILDTPSCMYERG